MKLADVLLSRDEVIARNRDWFADVDREGRGELPAFTMLARSWGRWIVRRTPAEIWWRWPDGSLTIEARK